LTHTYQYASLEVDNCIGREGEREERGEREKKERGEEGARERGSGRGRVN